MFKRFLFVFFVFVAVSPGLCSEIPSEFTTPSYVGKALSCSVSLYAAFDDKDFLVIFQGMEKDCIHLAEVIPLISKREAIELVRWYQVQNYRKLFGFYPQQTNLEHIGHAIAALSVLAELEPKRSCLILKRILTLIVGYPTEDEKIIRRWMTVWEYRLKF